MFLEKFDNKIETLFIIDILYMKDINACYGFSNGDKVIKSVYKLLNNNVREKIVRILKNIAKPDTQIEIFNPYTDIFMLKIDLNLQHVFIKKIADIILYEISTNSIKLKSLGLSINVDVTIGCSKCGTENIITHAERALHIAKTNHLHFSYFDPKFHESKTSTNDFIELIKSNISMNSIQPYFQGIYCNNEDKVYKYESLMRLHDSEGNILSPGLFLDKSKKLRLYPKLMCIMLEKVLNAVKEHKVHVSVNFEFNDILNPLLKSLLISQMEAYGIGKYITVEILESEKIQDFHMVRSFIQDIKAYGAKVAIDDFGSGFSNYDNILELDVDYIKLDGSLIQKIDQDVYYNLVKSIVSFCQNEGIKVVAEFVKDITILRYVKSLNIDFSQGYYLGKPEPIETVLKESYAR